MNGDNVLPMSIAERQPQPTSGDQGHRLSALLLGAAAVVGEDRVPDGGQRRRAVARPDEDAVTLAAEAAALALPDQLERVDTIILAGDTPVYQEGASVQLLAELLGLQGNVFALELPASRRDGVAAVRVGAALARDDALTLLCVSHVGSDGSSGGDGAVALLLGGDPGASAVGAPLATLTPAASSAIEIRDRWRLPGDEVAREADRSFAQAIGTDRLARDLLGFVGPDLEAPAVVVGPDPRASASLERSLGGPADAITAHTGIVGAAHPLLRLLAALDGPTLVTSLSNGLGEVLHVAPTAAGAMLAAEIRELAENGGQRVDRAVVNPTPADFDPFSSGPRAWRDRDVDLRLTGLVGPAGGLDPVPGRRHPIGTVQAWTSDHVYPGARTTETVTVTMDDGGQFYGQVAMGEHTSIGDRVELVPRRLHHGGGMVQYFWKVKPCR
jgi:hypothetical protein